MEKFTIKHVDEANLVETFYGATEIVFFRGFKKFECQLNYWPEGEREASSIDNGTAYVMNQNGKTISIYRFFEPAKEP